MPRDINKSGIFCGLITKSTKVPVQNLMGVIFGGFSATFFKHKTKCLEKNKIPQKVYTKEEETEKIKERMRLDSEENRIH